jgi:hypothetical protein
MSLYHGDLKNTVLKKVSVDEFEPKTGESAEVIVIAFSVLEKEVGEDLYSFINSGVRSVRDVEVSPNPDLDGYYIVFVEIDRTEYALDDLRELISDIENLTGKLNWQIRTHLTDRYWPLNSDEVSEFLITNPKNYQTREEYQQQQQEERELRAIQQQEEQGEQMQAESSWQRVQEFFTHSDLEDFQITENQATLKRRGLTVNLELVAYGQADQILERLGLNAIPIQEGDSRMKKFNQMLGTLTAQQLGEHMVIQGAHTTDIVVVKPC